MLLRQKKKSFYCLTKEKNAPICGKEMRFSNREGPLPSASPKIRNVSAIIDLRKKWIFRVTDIE